MIDTVAGVTGVERPDGEPAADRPVDGLGARALLRLLDVLPGRRDDAVAIVNGLFGDTLEDRGSELATSMSLRTGDTALPLDRDRLALALADSGTAAERRICVLVHGLMSTESIWRFPRPAAGSPATDAGTAAAVAVVDDITSTTTYGTLLAEDHDMTVLSLRYNTGRPIAANGRELADLLNRLVAAWPVRVREIDLIGHSMGGLVVRSACHYGSALRPIRRRWWFGRRWTKLVRRVVLIGVPNTGAGLEALVASVSAALASFPVAAGRVVGRALDRRSAGIKDLRLGTILDGTDDGRVPPSPLRRAAYLVVAGSVTADPDHRFAKMFGDALVTSASAAGRSAGGELLPDATIRSFPKVTHNALAHHVDVHRTISKWW